jgi:hypothetical protein
MRDYRNWKIRPVIGLRDIIPLSVEDMETEFEQQLPPPYCPKLSSPLNSSDFEERLKVKNEIHWSISKSLDKMKAAHETMPEGKSVILDRVLETPKYLLSDFESLETGFFDFSSYQVD